MEMARSSVDYLQRLISWTGDLVFPPRCISCYRFATAVSNRYLCKRCQRTIPLRRSSECIGCKAPSSLGVPCPSCQPNFNVDQLLIAAHFDHPLLQKTIESYKYRFIFELHQPLVRILSTHVGFLQKKKSYNIFQNNPLVTAVPLHPYRLNWRGFNQSDLLARSFADTFQMQSALDILIRTRKTIPQAQTQDKQERARNVAGIFSCPNSSLITGRDIVLVDDVCTSGATLNECAKVMKEAGAKKVTALVVARG